LASVHARNEDTAARAAATLRAAYAVGGKAPEARDVIYERIGP
jgi:thymidine phosphorylase